MIWLGVDGGKHGAIAILNTTTESTDVVPMPLVDGDRGEYNLREIERQLSILATGGHVFATMEKLHAMPAKMGGSQASFQRGYALALFEGLFTALRIPYALVTPQRWQKEMLAGTSGTDTKQRSVIAAQRLFPGVSLLRTPKCRKPDDNLADSLLLALYGCRHFNVTGGQEKTA